MKNCKAILVSLLLGACPAVWADSFSIGTNYLGNMTNVSQALIAFSNAVATTPTDQANVYLALTRVLALPIETTGSNFLNRLQVRRSTNVFDLKVKQITNSSGKWEVNDNLDADEITAEIRSDIIPALGASDANLAQITDTTFTLFMPGSVTHFSDVTIDYGDVQMLRALTSAASVFGYTLHTWNLNAQFEAVSNIVATDKSIEAILSANPGLLTITNTSDLPLARSAFTNAVSCYMAASRFIRNRPAGGRFLFNLDMTNANDVNAEANFRTFITDLESSLGSPFGGTPGALAGAIPNATFYGAISSFTNHAVSLSNFFAGNFNLNSFLPTLTTNGITFIWDSFPETALTLGGVLTGLTETNLGMGFVKLFHAQAQLGIPGVTCQVVSTVGKDSNLQPLNGVVQGTDGNFYGTTQYGGDNGYGVFFRAMPNGGFTPLYSFGQGGPNFNGDPLDGMWPSSVVLGSDGNFYGTTPLGGTNDTGTIFKFSKAGQLTTVYTFGDQDDGSIVGGNPLALAKSSSTFYGTTPYGGDNGEGAIFSFAPPSGFGATEGTFTTLASFPSTPQSNPYSYGAGAGALVQGSDGYFYGVTQYGGDNGAGSLFQFVPNGTSSMINTGYSFPFMSDAYGNPLALGINTPVQAASGVFFGTTQFGGNIYNSSSGLGDGTLCCIDTNGNFTNLFSFDENGFDGYNPIGAMVQGGDGAFYGLTSAGGANRDGTVFRYALGGTPSSVVWFDKGLGEQYGNNGGYYSYYNNTIYAGLINVSGEFYGTAPNGGGNGNGTVFSVAGTGLSGNYPPSISASPSSTTAGLGTGVTLTVSASGGGTLSYQWRKNGSTFNNSPPHATGATTADLTLSGLVLGDDGSYSVVVKNNYGSITSAVAVLTVVPAPTIFIQPATTNIGQGQALSLSVGASNSVAGGGALTYQWWGKGVSLSDGLGASGETISGSATSNLVINPAFGADSGSYFVTVSNAYAGTNSLFAVVTVGVAPYNLVVSPPSTNSLVGSNVTLTVSASGTALSYHWFKNATNALANGGRVSGATTNKLVLSALVLTDAGSYTVLVTNTYGKATSLAAVLNVVTPPVITNQPPAATNIAQGQQLSLSVGASNSPTSGALSYQWFTNRVSLTDGLGASGETISGSTTSNLVINPAYGADSGSYYVVVSNPYAAITSHVAFVTVGVAPTNLVVSPASTNSLVGSNVTLTASVAGTAPLSFHWFKNATNALSNGGRVNGATTNKLVLSALELTDTGNYTVVVTNTYGKATSMVAVLTVLQQPIIHTQPATPITIYQGQPLNLKVAATGSGTLIYQWLSNNVNLNDVPGSISGTATSNLVINPASTSDSASYAVVVANNVTNVTSSPSVVKVNVDTTKPSVTISSPAANARTNEPVKFSGTASESVSGVGVLITNVTYWITNLNGSATMSNSAGLAAGAGSVSNWTVSFTAPGFSPPAGSNIFAVQSRDFSGNTSAVVSLNFFWKSPAQLTLITNTGTGNGSVRGGSLTSGDTNVPSNGASLNVGQAYSVTETPGHDSYFLNWTGTSFNPIGATTNATLDFIMENGTSITATFITNIFVGMAGTYNGLFSDADLGVATEETAGLIGDLVLNTNGGFSATFQLAGPAPGPSGTFNHAGYWSNAVATTLGKVSVQLTVNPESEPRTITATVSGTNNILVNGTIQAGWTSTGQLIASLSNTSSDAPNYTLLIPPPTGSAGTNPPGYGYALLTNYTGTASAAPFLKIQGALADGATISQTVPIGEDNGIPVFQNPYSNNASGLLFGRLSLSDPLAASAPSGTLTWIRKAAANPTNGFFKPGMTNYPVVQGSYWSNSLALTNIIVTNSQFSVVGAGVNTNVAVYVSPTNHTNIVSNTHVQGFRSASVNTNTGQLTLVFTNYGNVLVTGYGALLQTPYILGSATNLGGGFFTMPSATASPTNAGSILFSPPGP